jgi:CBS domain-containing protein
MTKLMYTRFPRPMVLRSTTAAEMMTSNPLTFETDTPIRKAFALLTHHRIDAAPVVNHFGRPVGIVTKSDCAAWQDFTRRSMRGEFRPDETPVSEIMSSSIELIQVDELSHVVFNALIERRVRRVYAIDDKGKLVGVISMSDALRHLVDSGVKLLAEATRVR